MSAEPAVIDQEHLPTCKMGQGAECCRYLVFASGFACAKLTPLKFSIDARGDSMNARGDNCPGWPLAAVGKEDE